MTLAIIFDSVGVGEWFLLLAVVLVVVGPKRLPSTARKFGQVYSKFRRAADGFKRQLLEMDTELTNAVSQVEREVSDSFKDVADELPPIGGAASDGTYDDGYLDGGPDDYHGENDYGDRGGDSTSAPAAAATPAPEQAVAAAKPKRVIPGPTITVSPAPSAG